MERKWQEAIPLVGVAGIVADKGVVHGLDLGVHAGSGAARGVVSLFDDIPAGVVPANDSAHGGYDFEL